VSNSARAAGVAVSADGRGLVSQAGAVLLRETVRVTGLGQGLPESLARWRAPRAADPGRLLHLGSVQIPHRETGEPFKHVWRGTAHR